MRNARCAYSPGSQEEKEEWALIRALISFVSQDHSLLIELLPDRRKATIMQALSRIKGHDHIRTVVIGCWRPYREAIAAVSPDATTVCDKFHVLKQEWSDQIFTHFEQNHVKRLREKSLPLHQSYLFYIMLFLAVFLHNLYSFLSLATQLRSIVENMHSELMARET